MKNEKRLIPAAERKDSDARDEGEKRRREWLATIDPRQREDLDPKDKP